MQQPATPAPKVKFAKLTGPDKLKFVAKLMVFLISFGFAFPLLLSD